MKNINRKYDKTLVVRITNEQYTKLLETIIQERKKGLKSSIKDVDKSKIIREMLDKYGSGMS
jgi:DNA-binding protein H-NS